MNLIQFNGFDELRKWEPLQWQNRKYPNGKCQKHATENARSMLQKMPELENGRIRIWQNRK
jgi:hypothetical protein